MAQSPGQSQNWLAPCQRINPKNEPSRMRWINFTSCLKSVSNSCWWMAINSSQSGFIGALCKEIWAISLAEISNRNTKLGIDNWLWWSSVIVSFVWPVESWMVAPAKSGRNFTLCVDTAIWVAGRLSLLARSRLFTRSQAVNYFPLWYGGSQSDKNRYQLDRLYSTYYRYLRSRRTSFNYQGWNDTRHHGRCRNDSGDSSSFLW